MLSVILDEVLGLFICDNINVTDLLVEKDKSVSNNIIKQEVKHTLFLNLTP